MSRELELNRKLFLDHLSFIYTSIHSSIRPSFYAAIVEFKGRIRPNNKSIMGRKKNGP
jgi:hypothetical protein